MQTHLSFSRMINTSSMTIGPKEGFQSGWSNLQLLEPASVFPDVHERWC